MTTGTARPQGPAPREPAEEAVTLAAIGQRIRSLRARRGTTLKRLAEACNLSQSMLSLVERGKASPSLSSLLLIARALGVPMSGLLVGDPVAEDNLVTRFREQPVVETADHVKRRVLKQDLARNVLITHNDYAPGVGNSRTPIVHTGYEYGLVIEGELTIEVEGVSYRLGSGDLISHKANRPHRIWNYGRKPARAIWFNIDPNSS